MSGRMSEYMSPLLSQFMSGLIMSGCMCQNVCQKNVCGMTCRGFQPPSTFWWWKMVKVHKLSRWGPQTIPNMLFQISPFPTRTDWEPRITAMPGFTLWVPGHDGLPCWVPPFGWQWSNTNMVTQQKIEQLENPTWIVMNYSFYMFLLYSVLSFFGDYYTSQAFEKSQGCEMDSRRISWSTTLGW